MSQSLSCLEICNPLSWAAFCQSWIKKLRRPKLTYLVTKLLASSLVCSSVSTENKSMNYEKKNDAACFSYAQWLVNDLFDK